MPSAALQNQRPPRRSQRPALRHAPPRIVFLGDSLTAGLGVAPAQAYPALIQQRLRAAGYPHEVVNAGVSGDTSAGGLRRLDWSLAGRCRGAGRRARRQRRPARSAAVAISRRTSARSSSARAGAACRCCSRAWKRRRTSATATRGSSARSIRRSRSAYHVPLIPFLLAGVAGDPALNQADGIHPEPRRPSHHRRPGLAAARAHADVAAHSMIELRGVSKTVMSGTSPLTILHPLDLHVPAGRVARDHGTVGQRQVHAARAHRRPRRADVRPHPDRRRRTSRTSARTRWPGCAARRSGSCSSSFT